MPNKVGEIIYPFTYFIGVYGRGSFTANNSNILKFLTRKSATRYQYIKSDLEMHCTGTTG